MSSAAAAGAAATPAGCVSVLIATFNRGPMLDECLASVLSQSVAPHQVIVIDDGSTDDTAARVARWAPRVEYLRKDNGGKARALNLALPRVTGDYVWVFDDDDVALSRSIEMRLLALNARPDAAVVFSRHTWGESGPDGSIRPTVDLNWPALDDSNLLLTLMQGCFTTLQGTLARADCYREVGPFRDELLRSQDYDMLIRLARRFPVVRLDRPTFIFRRHSGQRGPGMLRHAAADRELVWARYDAMLGRAMRRETALGDYLVPRAFGELTDERQLTAVLNRFCVMASKGLADEMIEDALRFVQLADKRGVHSLDSGQRRIVTSAAQHRYFLLSVVAGPARFMRGARALAARPLGREMLRRLSRGLVGLAVWGSMTPVLRLRTGYLATRLLVATVLRV